MFNQRGEGVCVCVSVCVRVVGKEGEDGEVVRRERDTISRRILGVSRCEMKAAGEV